MNNKTAWLFLVAALIAAALACAGWYRASEESGQLRLGELEPIAALLKQDQDILLALQTNAGLEKDSGILAAYLSKIRTGGVAKNAEMKQRLDRLAENNSAILTLVDVFAPRAKTPGFSTEADQFRRYAIAWRDRWNSVMELFMAGGNYPVAEVLFPRDFASAVRAEMDALGGPL